jgi:hypothetical protein
VSESVKIGLAAENNLSDLPDKGLARANLGLSDSILRTISDLSLAGVTNADFQNLVGTLSNLQGQIDTLQINLSNFIPRSGTIAALTVDGTVNANLFLSPNGTPIGTSTDSFWSTDGAGGIQYAGNVSVSSLIVGSTIGFDSDRVIDLSSPDYAYLSEASYSRAIGVPGSESIVIPVAEVESLDIQFFGGSTINQVTGLQALSYTCASTRTYTNFSGDIVTAAINEITYEHDPITAERLGISLEEADTNLVTQSNLGTGWTATQGAITNNNLQSPVSGVSAGRFVPNAGNNEAFCTISFIPTARTHVFEALVKSDYRYLILQIGTGAIRVCFDLSGDGSISYLNNLVDPQIQKYKNGWYLIRGRSDTLTIGLSTPIRFHPSDNQSDSTNATTHNGTKALWLSRVNAKNKYGSHIPTTGTAVTRLATVLTNNGNSWLNPTSATIEIEYRPLTSPNIQTTDRNILTLTGTQGAVIAKNARNGFAKVSIGGNSIAMGAIPEDQTSKILLSLSTNQSKISSSNTTETASQAFGVSGLSGLTFGAGIFRRIRIWRSPLDSVLEAYKLPQTWGNLMLSKYEIANSHGSLSKIARDFLISRLVPGGHLQSNYGSRTEPDFFFVLRSIARGLTTNGTIAKTGAPLRWDVDGTIYNQNNLPTHTIQSNGVFLCSAENFLNLTQFLINTNQFSGAAPNWNFPNLTQFFINTNQFSGAAPNWNFPNLTQFFIHTNQFTGAAPNWNFPNLTLFVIRNNQFSGTAPNWNFPNLSSFIIFDNQFSGTAPNWNFPSLSSFFIFDNQFSSLSGTSSISGTSNLKDIRIQNNSLNQSSIDSVLLAYDSNRNYYANLPGDLNFTYTGGSNSAASTAGLNARTSIINAFSAAGKTATIT